MAAASSAMFGTNSATLMMSPMAEATWPARTRPFVTSPSV